MSALREGGMAAGETEMDVECVVRNDNTTITVGCRPLCGCTSSSTMTLRFSRFRRFDGATPPPGGG